MRRAARFRGPPRRRTPRLSPRSPSRQASRFGVDTVGPSVGPGSSLASRGICFAVLNKLQVERVCCRLWFIQRLQVKFPPLLFLLRVSRKSVAVRALETYFSCHAMCRACSEHAGPALAVPARAGARGHGAWRSPSGACRPRSLPRPARSSWWRLPWSARSALLARLWMSTAFIYDGSQARSGSRVGDGTRSEDTLPDRGFLAAPADRTTHSLFSGFITRFRKPGFAGYF